VCFFESLVEIVLKISFLSEIVPICWVSAAWNSSWICSFFNTWSKHYNSQRAGRCTSLITAQQHTASWAKNIYDYRTQTARLCTSMITALQHSDSWIVQIPDISITALKQLGSAHLWIQHYSNQRAGLCTPLITALQLSDSCTVHNLITVAQQTAS